MRTPTLEYESRLWRTGYQRVAGLDEVGRGAWAGPVVAAAVILPCEQLDLLAALEGVNDSKALSPSMRQRLLPRILRSAVTVGIGLASERFIDSAGIVQATRQAMALALRQLAVPPQYLLIDALLLPDVGVTQRALIRGDSQILSIAAASVVAKVFRDQLMAEKDHYFPGYGFSRHKGYGTAAHRKALTMLGPCPLHRMSFAPVRASLLGEP